MKDETVWFNLEQITKLFDRDKSVISKHIKNALKEELEKEATVAFFVTVQKEVVVANFAIITRILILYNY